MRHSRRFFNTDIDGVVAPPLKRGFQRAVGGAFAAFLSVFVASQASALPADDLQLRALESDAAPWGLGVFYQLSPVDAGLQVRADLGAQLSYAFGASKNASALVHVQRDSLLFAFSHMTKPLFASPTRWTLAMDMRSPYSYFAEGQIYFPLGRLEPYTTFRIQSTGYAVAGADASLFEGGAPARFWMVSGALGASYSLHAELRLAASFVYRHAFGTATFQDPGVFRVSMQWLWGAQPH